MNTFGKLFRLTTFGESHGPAIGGIIDGVPAGLHLNTDEVQLQLDRRRPGASALTTARKEADTVKFLSGLEGEVTTGAPIGFVIENSDHRGSDYEWLRHAFRPGHADYAYTAKYGLRTVEGGGRASARETACRVVGGAVAMQLLAHYGVSIESRIVSVGTVENPTTEQLEAEIIRVKAEGNTIGGVIECVANGVPAGWGDPLADKLTAMLAAAMMSIPAARGFEVGMGFAGCSLPGSETIDRFTDGFRTLTNHSGGIQGGISNGNPIVCRVAFKAIATLMQPVEGSDDRGNALMLEPRGRHDSCVLPRALPVVDAMMALTLADAMLAHRLSRL